MPQVAIKPQETKIVMNDNMFGKLLDALKPYDSSLDTLGLRSKVIAHELDVYSHADEDYSLGVNNFGYMASSGKWIECELTEAQKQLVNEKLDAEYDRLLIIKKSEYNNNTIPNDYKEQGLYGIGY